MYVAVVHCGRLWGNCSRVMADIENYETKCCYLWLNLVRNWLSVCSVMMILWLVAPEDDDDKNEQWMGVSVVSQATDNGKALVSLFENIINNI